MKIRLIAIVFLLLFASIEVKKFMEKSEKELSQDNIRNQIELESGDIIVRKEINALSDFLSTIDGAGYSHIGIVKNTQEGLKVFHIEVDEKSEDLKVSTIKEFVNFAKKIAVYRYEDKIEEEKLSQILSEYSKKNIKFDYDFELDNEKLYCTEFVNDIYLKLFNENLYTYLYNFYEKDGISINSIIKNPKLKKRFELEF